MNIRKYISSVQVNKTEHKSGKAIHHLPVDIGLNSCTVDDTTYHKDHTEQFVSHPSFFALKNFDDETGKHV